MLAEIVFVTRFLALVAGPQPVTLEADASVRTVEIRSNSVKIATLTSPPWSLHLDFGKDLMPQELTAIAFDGEGREVGRDTQTINLPRPLAEISLMLNRKDDALTARVASTNLMGKEATSFVATLDGKEIQRAKTILSSFPLPALNSKAIHSLGVDIEFADQTRARKEIVFGGIYSEEVPADLTPIAVRARGKATTAAMPACFTLKGEPILPTAIEDDRARAYFVLVGSGGLGRQRIGGTLMSEAPFQLPRTELVAVASAAHTVTTSAELKTDIFEYGNAPDFVGVRRLISRYPQLPGDLRITDAVAAAGLRALGDGKRRVVVLVIGGRVPTDHSTHAPQTVRRYLERIGVPFRVWSLDGPRPDLEEAWGLVQDVSRINYLFLASEELTKELASQRIAWVPASPLHAIRIQSSVDCAYAPLAKQ